MGKLIESLALSKGDLVLSKINRENQDWDNALLADTWIDFSHAALVQKHIEKAIEAQKNIVIGTTGWEELLPQIKEQVKGQSSAILYAPNCSLGMLLFMKILKQSAQIMSSFNEYEVGGFEAHHSEKKDSPSGTACKLSSLLEKEYKKEIPFTSLRLGSIMGKHEVYYDSPVDSITLTHEAKSRLGFASGALNAARWLEEKQGFYTLDDYIEGVLQNA